MGPTVVVWENTYVVVTGLLHPTFHRDAHEMATMPAFFPSVQLVPLLDPDHILVPKHHDFKSKVPPPVAVLETSIVKLLFALQLVALLAMPVTMQVLIHRYHRGRFRTAEGTIELLVLELHVVWQVP